MTTKTGTAIKNITSATYTQASLTNGTTYYYIVTAVDSGGESAASAEVHATPLPPAPAAPAGLAAAAGAGQVALSWTASSGASSYNAYYATKSGVTTASGIKLGSISGTKTNVSGLTAGTPYFFVVTAENAGGESAVSNEVSATPLTGHLRPAAAWHGGDNDLAGKRDNVTGLQLR